MLNLRMPCLLTESSRPTEARKRLKDVLSVLEKGAGPKTSRRQIA